MSCKNLKQYSLADALLVEHKALTELDEVHELVDCGRIEMMLKDIHSNPRSEQAWPHRTAQREGIESLCR